MHINDFDCFEDRNRRFAGRRGPGSPDRPEHTPGERKHHSFPHGFGGHGPAGSERGFGFRGRGGFGRGFGEGRGRLFDAGDVKLVILKLLSEQPSYGYQLIKTMEQRMAGGYTPSAGVIYPTLTLVEEEGLAAVSLDNNKKVYALTPEGIEYLEANKEQVGELFMRLEETGRGFERGRSPEMIKAFLNLRGAVIARVSRESVKPEQIKQIVDAINSAAHVIDEL
jgi:DNA-binding PadR family transcriptional regulator